MTSETSLMFKSRRPKNTMPAQMLLFVLSALTTITLAAGQTGYPFPIAKPGCPERCGDISIPYPFGTTDGCYLGADSNSEFLVICNDTGVFLHNRNAPITEIMLLSGEARFLVPAAHLCNIDGIISNKIILSFNGGALFTLSYSKNSFMAVGCDAQGLVAANATFTTGCISGCTGTQDVVNGSCDGIGCCHVSVPKRTKELSYSVERYQVNISAISNICNSAFLLEKAAYSFTSDDFNSPTTKDPTKPVIFDWSIGTTTCSANQNQPGYVCGANSFCGDYDNGLGYRCNCNNGFRGNPYLPNGCQDIDECTLNDPCNVHCINLPGGFHCSPCRKGYKGDGYRNGRGCERISSTEKILSISLGTSLGFIAILLLGGGLNFILQKRKLNQLRYKNYKENGGLTLQQLLSQHKRHLSSFKIYTADELMKATHSYDESKILGKGGQGTVYKGELVDNTIVAIKKSNVMDKNQVDSFVNEIIILSQTNHRNVVKLLGCCLQTEIPMLVYEFITNGTLSDYIRKDSTPQMPWHTRVRIAAETAEGISYLHSAAAIPIIHRDIKTANILLDVGYTAKVADFGVSKLAHVDKTSLATNVVGTFGYLDPEYFASGILTEKSDVYSFGVVLLELLTGSKPINTEMKEAEKSLAIYFMSCMKEGRLDDIVDENLKRNVSGTQLEEVASVAARCLNERGEDRPSMKEVARVLEKVAKREIDHPWVAIDLNDEQETGVLLHEPVRSYSSSDLNDERETGVLLHGPVRSTTTSNATTFY